MPKIKIFCWSRVLERVGEIQKIIDLNIIDKKINKWPNRSQIKKLSRIIEYPVKKTEHRLRWDISQMEFEDQIVTARKRYNKW